MRKEFDIAPTRSSLGIVQPELADELGIDYRALGAIERGQVPVTEDYHATIHAAIERLHARKQECQQTETMASAAS